MGFVTFFIPELRPRSTISMTLGGRVYSGGKWRWSHTCWAKITTTVKMWKDVRAKKSGESSMTTEKWNKQKHLRQRKSSDSQESYNTPTEHTAGNLPNQNKNPFAGSGGKSRGVFQRYVGKTLDAWFWCPEYISLLFSQQGFHSHTLIEDVSNNGFQLTVVFTIVTIVVWITTVDGRNPAPPGMYKIWKFTISTGAGFLPSTARPGRQLYEKN